MDIDDLSTYLPYALHVRSYLIVRVDLTLLQSMPI